MYLQTKNLTKVFGKQTAVDHLDLTVERGSLTALLGPNGAGKSTTVEMLLGLLPATSGEISYAKKAPRIGVVFQNSVLDNELTVSENLRVRAKLSGKFERQDLVSVAEKLGVSDFLNKRYGKLSGGQRRRVDIVRALLGQPEILFLDEPTTGLDIQTRRAIWSALAQLRQQQSLTIILTTHYLEEADNADMVYVIDQGKAVAAGSADQLKQKYARSRLVLQSKQLDQLKDLLGPAAEYERMTEDSLQVFPQGPQHALKILALAAPLVTDFEYRQGTMNDAFIALTGKEMH